MPRYQYERNLIQNVHLIRGVSVHNIFLLSVTHSLKWYIHFQKLQLFSHYRIPFDFRENFSFFSYLSLFFPLVLLAVVDNYRDLL